MHDAVDAVESLLLFPCMVNDTADGSSDRDIDQPDGAEEQDTPEVPRIGAFIDRIEVGGVVFTAISHGIFDLGQ